tara:strand:+ start:2164 stop:2475 length:312 start_codon:yes stop_codon:yes gene_type:complete
MKWPFKDPDEIQDYSVDWSRFLGTYVINSVNWYIRGADGVKTLIQVGETVDGLKLGGVTTTATVATARWSEGTANKTYRITCAVTYNTTLVVERVIQLPVKER